MLSKTKARDILIEKLCADNFLSLHNFKYEVKQFNVITGDMAAGKSLIMKALEFFNNIFEPLMNMMFYEEFIEDLEIETFHERVIRDFMIRFNLKDNIVFDIQYSCSFNDVEFRIKLFRNKNEKKISLESDFLDRQLSEWKNYIEKYIKEKKKNSKYKKYAVYLEFAQFKNELLNMLFKKFGGFYPATTFFVPATRAALATRATLTTRQSSDIDKINFQDYYLNVYEKLIESLKMFPKTKYCDKIHEILKASIEINGDIHLLSEGREADIGYASSGQQESFYILFLLEKLPVLVTFYKNNNIYIEEPEAHLFPLGQKLTLELVAQIFNDINTKSKRSPVKFFITTHSPYVLNTINNMLLKGSIEKNFFSNEKLKKYAECGLNDDKVKKIPNLNCEKVSAIFINKKGRIDDILIEYKGNLLIDPEEITRISIDNAEEYNFLDNLNDKLLNGKNA